MREFFRLLFLFVIILPLAVLLIGPLLTLAGLRGVQRVGPIVLNPARQGALGRIGALWLGLLIWLAVWGGLAIILMAGRLSGLSGVPSPTLQAHLTTTAPVVVLTSSAPLPSVPSQMPVTLTRLPGSAQSPPTAAPTQPPREKVPTLFPSPTPSPVPPTSTPVAPTATATPVPLAPTPLATATAISPPTPVATLSPAQIREAITAVEAANDLLRSASIEPSIGNLAALGTLWQDRALAKAQAFAQNLYQRYLRPPEVTFSYLIPPVVLGGNTSDTAFVISTEEWTYSGLRESHTESFEFTYTLRRQTEGWVIIEYSYRNVPKPLPLQSETVLTTPLTSTAVTATAIITPTGQ